MSSVIDPAIEVGPKVVEIQPSPLQDVLVRAAEIVEAGWTQWTFARDENGTDVAYDNPRAVKFCMWGAFYLAYKEKFGVEYGEDDALNREMDKKGMDASWNDLPERTQEQVVTRLREIALQF